MIHISRPDTYFLPYFGGSTCVKTFNVTVKAKCVICPNTAYQRIVEKLATYFASISVDCPSSVTSGAALPSTYTGGGGSVTVLPPNYVQGGEGGGISGYSLAIVPMGDCKCMICDDKNPCTDDLCENGACKPPVPKNCDDGLYCTSLTGTEPGSDGCEGGTCYRRKIADKEDTTPVTVKYDIPGIVSKVLEWLQKLGITGKVNLVGKLDYTKQSFERCCEEKKAILTGKKGKLGGGGDIKGEEIPVWYIGIPKIGKFKAIIQVGGKYSLNATGKREPCANTIEWSGGGSVGAELSGGGQIDTIGDVISGTGTVGSGVNGKITVSGTEGKVALTSDGVKVTWKAELKWIGEISGDFILIESFDVGSFTFAMPEL